MFARRTTAEVVASDKNLCVAILRFVQDEISDFVALTVVTHFVEQVYTQTRTFDRLKKDLWDDHIGVDVHQRHRCCDTLKCFKLFHYIISRTSVSLPVIAAAAAIAGETRWVRPL